MEGLFAFVKKGHANKSGIDGSEKKMCDERKRQADYITKSDKRNTSFAENTL